MTKKLTAATVLLQIRQTYKEMNKYLYLSPKPRVFSERQKVVYNCYFNKDPGQEESMNLA